MIKFFQKLKAKKGFTLVELIVVIAIIGVLAAILVPTMLGYVTSSRVTSADTTASKIEDGIDTFLTTADVAGYGMKQSNGAMTAITGEVDANGSWSLSNIDVDAFKDGGTMAWAATGTGTSTDNKTSAGDASQLLAIELAKLFPDVKSVCFEAYLVAGDCAAVWYTADTATAQNVASLSGHIDDATGKWSAVNFEWDGETAGVSSEGYIVGTSPKLGLDTEGSNEG